MPRRFDVAIMGAGPAGSAIALLLARDGFSVVVCDAPRKSFLLVGETLPNQAMPLLRHLGLWEPFLAQGHTPSPGIMSVWGSPSLWTTEFIFSPFGNGWHLDRPRFNHLLANGATAAGAVILRDTQVTAHTHTDDGQWNVAAFGTQGSVQIQCRFLVDATGRTAGSRLGFPGRRVSDRLIAVAGLSCPASSTAESEYTLVEAVEGGWFYSALLPFRQYVVAFMTDADFLARSRMGATCFLEAQLHEAQHTRERIGGRLSAVGVFPAFSSCRRQAAGSDWIAVGDAARSYDPLSGLGLCMSIDSALEAVRAIEDSFEGNPSALSSYDERNARTFSEHERSRLMYYGMEQRWPESEFWQRRRIFENEVNP